LPCFFFLGFKVVVVTGLQIVVVVVGTIVVVVVVAPAMVVEDGSEVVVVAGAVVVVGAQVGFFFSVVVVTGLRTGFLGFGRRVVTVSVIVACQRTRVPPPGIVAGRRSIYCPNFLVRGY